MADPTPTTILGAITLDQVRAKLVAYLQGLRDPVTYWGSGGVRRTQLEVAALGLQDLAGSAVPTLGGSGELATAPTDAWVNLVVTQIFALARAAAVFTQQAVRLTCDGSHGPYTIGAGFVVQSAVTGRRYRAVAGGTLSTSSTLTITVQAESPGPDYADPAGSLTVLPNPLPGVTSTNPAPAFSPVTSTPSPALGLGVVSVSGTAAVNPTAYDLLVTADGQNTTAKFQWRANGGLWSAPVTMAATFTIPSTAIVVAFANDAGGSTPSFRAGDLYSFTSPGSPITQFGVAAEVTSALIARALARWPPLVAGAVTEKHAAWAKAASAAVYRVRVSQDATYPGRNNVTIAGAPGTGALAGGIVTAVQTAIDQQEAIGDISVVAAASATTVTATGTVQVAAAQLAIVQTAAEAAWVAYVNGTDIGGVVRIAKLEQILMDAGAIDVSGLLINAAAVNLQLSASAVGVAADISQPPMTWVPV